MQQLKGLKSHIIERQQDVDALGLTTNPPRTRAELVERLKDARQSTGAPVNPLGRGYFSVALQGGHGGPFVLKYTKPDSRTPDGWINWGWHCYNKWQNGVHTTYPNVQFIHEFEDDMGFYAIMEKYKFFNEDREGLGRAMMLQKIKDYLDNFWGWENFKDHYSRRHLIFGQDTMENIHSFRILDMLHEDVRDMLHRDRWDGPVYNSMRDVYHQSGINPDFGNAINDLVDVCKSNRVLPDIHGGNAGFWGNGSSHRMVLTDPIGFTRDGRT